MHLEFVCKVYKLQHCDGRRLEWQRRKLARPAPARAVQVQVQVQTEEEGIGMNTHSQPSASLCMGTLGW